jgi:hypothetical protein
MPRVDVTKNYRRERQFSPTHCAAGSFRMKEVGEHGTKLVLCCPAGKWKRKRCKVGMKVQSVLKKR